MPGSGPRFNTTITRTIASTDLLVVVVVLCDSMDPSMPDFLILHHLQEFAQIHVHWVDDAIQPSHPLSPLSPPTLSLSQHQSLFHWAGSLNHIAKVLASASVLLMNIQDWFPLGLTDLISLQSKGLSRVFSSTTVQKYQFSGAQPSLQSNSHLCTWLLVKP